MHSGLKTQLFFSRWVKIPARPNSKESLWYLLHVDQTGHWAIYQDCLFITIISKIPNQFHSFKWHSWSGLCVVEKWEQDLSSLLPEMWHVLQVQAGGTSPLLFSVCWHCWAPSSPAWWEGSKAWKEIAPKFQLHKISSFAITNLSIFH